MAGYRIDRISEDIKREIVAVMRELKDPKVQETLAFLVEFAKVFGESQTRATGTA